MAKANILMRPTSLDEWFERGEQILFPLLAESAEHALAYKPGPTDIFISPYLKCGTTWLQQIVHTLRTGGDMDFDDISRVIPWFENAHAQGIDINSPQRGTIQAFKSHLSWDAIPKGGKYIVSIREPKDALISLYRFFDGWQFEKDSVSMEEFSRAFYTECKLAESYWFHLASWWEQRNDENVLLLCFEDMKDDLPTAVKRIADFVGIALNDQLLELILENSSLDFMRANKNKFDEKVTCEFNEKIGFIPLGGESSKVKSGRVGDHKKGLPEEVSKEMDLAWEKEIDGKLGVSSYQAMRDILCKS